MRLPGLIKFSLVLCLASLVPAPAGAYSFYGSDWRDNYPEACQVLQDATTNQMNCIMCHFQDSKDRNPYGLDFENSGYDFAAIESLDSDGDGRTNAEEILIDCSLPGDAVSPTDQNSWGGIKVLFR